MTSSRSELRRCITRPSRRAGPSAVAAAVAMALGVGLAPHAMAQSATQADVQTLKQQVQQLQTQIDQLQQQVAQPLPAPGTPHDVEEAADASPSFHAGPVRVTLGGFVELMVINRNRNESDDFASNYNGSIPYPNSHNYDLSEFHLSERQSRFAALAEAPEAGSIRAEGYLETDFGGAGGTANYNESSSFSPRVRHFYADLSDKDNGMFLLFGQTWSMVTAQKAGLEVRQENIPQVIDAQYVPGFSWLRVAQIRFVEKFNNVFSAGVSLENPAEQVTSNATTGAPALNVVYNNPGATNAFTAANNSTATNITTDYLPDVIVKVAADPSWGHYEAFALNRWFRSRDITAGEENNVKSTGQGYGANVVLPLVPKMVDFQAGVLAGKGIGRYGSAQLPDVTVNPNSLGLTPLRGMQALLGLIVHPTDTITTFLYAGKEMVDKQYWNVTSAGKIYQYGYGDPLLVNSGCETEGVGTCAANTSQIESGTIGGWWKWYSGPLGNAQVGITDTYVKREIFSGVGGDPNTNINIAMVSFRYYPFQK
jgi:type II secretory pathway pseudopilin PulG